MREPDHDLRIPAGRARRGVDRGEGFTFRFEGSEVTAHPGETVGAALLAAGHRVLRHTGSGRPRGLFCGIGACFDCLVTVDGAGPVRACQELARPGSEVATDGA